jgi:hypothetical protein
MLSRDDATPGCVISSPIVRRRQGYTAGGRWSASAPTTRCRTRTTEGNASPVQRAVLSPEVADNARAVSRACRRQGRATSARLSTGHNRGSRGPSDRRVVVGPSGGQHGTAIAGQSQPPSTRRFRMAGGAGYSAFFSDTESDRLVSRQAGDAASGAGTRRHRFPPRVWRGTQSVVRWRPWAALPPWLDRLVCGPCDADVGAASPGGRGADAAS